MSTIYKSQDGARAVEAHYRQMLADWPVANEHLRVKTRQGETFVIASGPKDAPALLLFHGSTSNSFTWMGDVEAWSENFRVYAIDMIGEPGLSAPSRPPLDSEAYAQWLDEVMDALRLTRASLIGMSLGGWLALDYATRRPKKVNRLALLCPGGVGRHKNILLWALPLLLLGEWGRRKVFAIIAGPGKTARVNPAVAELLALIFRNFRPRLERLPIITDAALKRLTIPVIAILGAKDLMVDSPGIARRLTQNVPRAEVRMLPKTGHVILGQTQTILEFLKSVAK